MIHMGDNGNVLEQFTSIFLNVSYIMMATLMAEYTRQCQGTKKLIDEMFTRI